MPRILLVEDSKFCKLATQRTLTKAGHEVLTAEDGEEALRVASYGLPSGFIDKITAMDNVAMLLARLCIQTPFCT